MDLVRIILMVFGLSLEDKAMDQIMRGLIMSILSFVGLFFIISMPYNRDFMVVLEKLGALCLLFFTICGYSLLKKRIEKFIGMYGAISAFDVRFRRKRSNVTWSTLILFVCFGMTYVSAIYYSFYNEEFNEIFSVRLNGIKLCVYHHLPLTGFITLLLLFGLIYLNFELCDKYYNSLEFSNKFIEKYLKYEPNLEIKDQVLDVIEEFEENENDFKLIVYPMRKIILMLTISADICFNTLFQHSFDVTSILSSFSCIFFFNLYYIYTQTVIHYKSKVKYILLSNIETWINSPDQQFVGKIITKEVISSTPSVIMYDCTDCLSDVD